MKIDGEKLDLDKRYRIASKEFIYTGRDGYDVLKNSPVIVSVRSFASANHANDDGQFLRLRGASRFCHEA